MTGQRAVVIGASFIGMEAAASLVQRGLHVTVIGPQSTPFERILGADVGGVVQAHHVAHGTHFVLGHGVSRIVGDGAVRGVELDDGATLDADLVVVGIGVQPTTEFVRGVELDPDGGLPVDEQLRVAPGVWAAGDVARYREPHTDSDVRIEHWRLRRAHARGSPAGTGGAAWPHQGRACGASRRECLRETSPPFNCGSPTSLPSVLAACCGPHAPGRNNRIADGGPSSGAGDASSVREAMRRQAAFRPPLAASVGELASNGIVLAVPRALRRG